MTHNDLDALGSELVILSVFKVQKSFHTNYGDMREVVNEILSYQKATGEDTIYIADVSFSEEIRQEMLGEICSAFSKIYLADHHQFPASLKEKEWFKKIEFHHTIDYCATKILYNLYKEKLPKKLEGLIEVINAYDVWITKSKLFDFSQGLNDYFWFKTEATKAENRYRITDLANLIISLGYDLPADYVSVVEQCKENHKREIKEVLDNKLLQRFNAKYKTTVILSWNSFNEIMIQEMKEGADFVIGICNGIFKVRISQETKFPADRLHEMRKFLTDNSEFGHEHAFTYKITKGDKEGIMTEVQKILTFINE